MYDGFMKGEVDAVSLFGFSGDNETYYDENYEIVTEKRDNVNYTRLKDKKAPVLNNVKILTNENTYNSIKLEIDAEDTGDGLDKYEVKYRKTSESQQTTIENNWEESEDNKNYVTIPNLEQGNNYKILLTVYDKEGNYVALDDPLEATTTSGVDNITLNKQTTTINKGATETLTATITPSNATNKSVEWTSSNNEVATVENGTVTAVGVGKTTITAIAVDGGRTATCEVTVVEPVTTIPVTGITLNKQTTTINKGATETLTATITPSNATNKSVEWTSSNNEVATVENGTVTAISAGTAIITATAVDGGKTATCEVTVVEPSTTIPVTGITLNKQTTTIDKGKTETLTATITPSNATNKSVKWTSNNNTVATVENGTVTAAGVGKATITATTEDGGKTATCEVTVVEPSTTIPVTGITLNKQTTTIDKGKTETLTATITPSNATNKSVKWTSNNNTVATVENGTVTAVGVGKATITATTEDGGKTATCEVTVVETQMSQNINLENISINKEEISLYVGETEVLKVEISPTNATIDKTVYTSSNVDVVTVDENGKITAVGKGISTITIVVVDKSGNVKAKQCKVTVNEKVTTEENNKNNTNTTENSTTEKQSQSATDKDLTTVKTILPKTGFGKGILLLVLVIIINGIIMFVKYKKMRNIK